MQRSKTQYTEISWPIQMFMHKYIAGKPPLSFDNLFTKLNSWHNQPQSNLFNSLNDGTDTNRLQTQHLQTLELNKNSSSNSNDFLWEC